MKWWHILTRRHREAALPRCPSCAGAGVFDPGTDIEATCFACEGSGVLSIEREQWLREPDRGQRIAHQEILSGELLAALERTRRGEIRSTITTDRTDPRLGHGVDTEPGPQNEVYLVADEGEFIRPVRRTYIHVGTDERGGCFTTTTMSQAIAETYARNPKFYGSTYCCGCRMHLPVAEFLWDDESQEPVGS